MSALDHPSLLVRLISASEMALQTRSGSDRDGLILLVNLIEDAAHKPSDNEERVISTEVEMCAHAVLYADKRLREHRHKQARPFLQVVGILLPEVRAALEQAIEIRKRPTP